MVLQKTKQNHPRLFQAFRVIIFVFLFSLIRVLLRVRMLYYLKQEVIGNEFQKVFDGIDAR